MNFPVVNLSVNDLTDNQSKNIWHLINQSMTYLVINQSISDLAIS